MLPIHPSQVQNSVLHRPITDYGNHAFVLTSEKYFIIYCLPNEIQLYSFWNKAVISVVYLNVTMITRLEFKKQ